MQSCNNVVSTLYQDDENPTSHFLTFLTSDQNYFNVDPKHQKNVDPTMKCWLKIGKTQHYLTKQIKRIFIHIFMSHFFVAEIIKLIHILSEFFSWTLSKKISNIYVISAWGHKINNTLVVKRQIKHLYIYNTTSHSPLVVFL